jgi:hypothetical protein
MGVGGYPAAMSDRKVVACVEGSTTSAAAQWVTVSSLAGSGSAVSEDHAWGAHSLLRGDAPYVEKQNGLDATKHQSAGSNKDSSSFVGGE